MSRIVSRERQSAWGAHQPNQGSQRGFRCKDFWIETRERVAHLNRPLFGGRVVVLQHSKPLLWTMVMGSRYYESFRSSCMHGWESERRPTDRRVLHATTHHVVSCVQRWCMQFRGGEALALFAREETPLRDSPR